MDEEPDGEWYDVILEGGFIPSGRTGTEDFIGAEAPEKLALLIPDFVKELNYKDYNVGHIFNLESEFALKLLFPELPEPGAGDNSFKAKAIEVINSINDEQNQFNTTGCK
jgi:hypothetical protein